jgi:hypothetical protein
MRWEVCDTILMHVCKFSLILCFLGQGLHSVHEVCSQGEHAGHWQCPTARCSGGQLCTDALRALDIVLRESASSRYGE